MSRYLVYVIGFSVLLWGSGLPAQTPSGIEGRLIRIEEGQRALGQRIDDTNQRIDDFRADANQRFEELRADMNQRFGELRADMNQRFGDLNSQFSALQLWFQIMSGIFALALGWLVRQEFVTSRRLTQVESVFSQHLQESEKDQTIAMQRQEMNGIKDRLGRLEGNQL